MNAFAALVVELADPANLDALARWCVRGAIVAVWAMATAAVWVVWAVRRGRI